MTSLEVDERATLGDLVMDHSKVGDSFTRRSDQAAMLGNMKELAFSLVEMKISLEDLSMKEAAVSQKGDAQQPQGDGVDPMNVDPKDVQESKGDPI